LPVATRPSQYLGEAQAVVGDAREAPKSVVEKRVSQADELLSHVEETGSERADEHVERARELTTRILSELV
jgi:vacuolar-type H+-ATPase subunit H